jgi:isopentenyl-diphosphate delta-isomerase
MAATITAGGATVITSRDAGVAADSLEEVFDTYTEEGLPLGQELRKICHAKGIWHRAVYCFVFNCDGHLLIQRRSAAKKIGAGQWDLSAAEHLSPGENFKQGVVRGLQEELGINVEAAAVHGPLAPTHKRQLVLPEIGVLDFEFVESYRLDGYNGPIAFNDQEVSEVKFVSLAAVKADMQSHPDAYTQWFREELASLSFFGA